MVHSTLSVQPWLQGKSFNAVFCLHNQDLTRILLLACELFDALFGSMGLTRVYRAMRFSSMGG